MGRASGHGNVFNSVAPRTKSLRPEAAVTESQLSHPLTHPCLALPLDASRFAHSCHAVATGPSRCAQSTRRAALLTPPLLFVPRYPSAAAAPSTSCHPSIARTRPPPATAPTTSSAFLSLHRSRLSAVHSRVPARESPRPPRPPRTAPRQHRPASSLPTTTNTISPWIWALTSRAATRSRGPCLSQRRTSWMSSSRASTIPHGARISPQPSAPAVAACRRALQSDARSHANRDAMQVLGQRI